MRKTNPQTDYDKLRKLVHDLWNDCDDEMDRQELKAFVDDENQPRMAALNGDDRIGVSEVLIIGGYLALNKLHNDIHRLESADIEDKISAVMTGKVELKEIAPKDMPPEVVEALEKLVTIVRAKKNADKKKRGK